MTLPSSPPLSLTQIQTEFGGPGNLISYYSGGGFVQSGTANGTSVAIPSSGALSLDNFLGASAVAVPTSFKTANTVSGASPFSAVAFGANIFVATDIAGGVYSSSDGITWTNRTSNTKSFGWQTVEFVNSTFIAVGSSGVYTHSTDGVTWSTVQMNVGASKGDILCGIQFLGSNYVIAAQDGAFANVPHFYTSTSLTSATGWTSHTVSGISGFGYFPGPGTASDGFAASLKKNSTGLCALVVQNTPLATFALTSSDGSTWISTNVASVIVNSPTNQGDQGIATDGTDFYFINGANSVYQSNTVGSGWSGGNNATLGVIAGATNTPAGGIFIINGVFIYVGTSSSGSVAQVAYITGNPVGGTWHGGGIGTSSSAAGIAFGNGKYVVVGRGASFTGVVWNQ